MPRHKRPVVADVIAEFEGSALGDARLDRRLVSIAETMAAEPDASFPRAAENDSELEATYRFLSNEGVSAQEIVAPHRRRTVERASAVAQVVVAHDTTEFNFGTSPREDLGRVGRGKSYGFYGHFALAVDADEHRSPLGVIAFEVYARSGGKGRRGHRALQSDPSNEFHRWRRGLAAAASTLEGMAPVHVMDREADSYAFMAELAEQGHRFVIRMAQATRRLADEDASVGEVIAGASALAEREVPLSPRPTSRLPSYRKLYPARRGRMARLHISATRVTLARPASANQSPARTLCLNVVRAFEPDPPPGQPAVEWRLWTTEPIDTPEQLLAVVDFYRCRWRIEEFFKALKAGCAIERRQLESQHALVNALALLCPIAWRLLLLRTLAHQAEDVPASAVLTKRQLICLRGLLKKKRRPPLPARPTARDAMFGVAAIGGHISNNGDPGWAVLGRGLDKLLTAELGYSLAVDDGEM